MRLGRGLIQHFLLLVICGFFLGAMPSKAYAHCDTLDGPVIIDAKLALEKGDVAPVLKWVKKEYEAEIKETFNKTLKTRTKGPEAKELADRYFFETVVRVHRAGEGAPYTGLKPAGAVEPAIAAADKAIETGAVDDLAKKMSGHVSGGIHERFNRLIEAKKHMDESVEAGREYVEAYVGFVHFVEAVHNLVSGTAHHNPVKETSGREHKH